MARMDAITMKMDAQYKQFQSHSKQPNIDHNDDDKPMSPEEEAKFMQTFRRTCFYNDYHDRMPNYGKFLKELVCNKHKLKQISSAFLSDESLAMIQNKVLPKLGDLRSFLIPCNFSKAYSCNALADLSAIINLMSSSLYAKLSLETLKPTKISVRLADRSFQHPIRIAKNMCIEVGKFTFPIDFVILEMEEDSKVPLIFGRPFLHTTDAVIQVKHTQLNLGVGTKRITFLIDSIIKHSYSNDDTCFSIDVIDEILEEDFDALLDEGSKIPHSIEGTILKEKHFTELDEFMEMTADENSKSDFDIEKPPIEMITFNIDYKIKTSLEGPPLDLELKPLPERIVLGHKVSGAGLKVDKAKVDVISKLPPPTNVKGPETHTIIDQCHHRLIDGHYEPNTIAKKVLDTGFYWLTIIKEAHILVRLCEACQKKG
uniref:Reverse transcriptase domain-containing protein n=1 Tax=Tanacetum cinerariifolium TaxID=118510 RepID=A0A6L2P4H4_TANCI|nr:reverse transcriptase domain-containing protein [Tanacetum cinerariifolium]